MAGQLRFSMGASKGLSGCGCCGPGGCNVKIGVSNCLTSIMGFTGQTLTIFGAPTGGTFKLGWTTQLGAVEFTTAIAYNAKAADVQAALEAVPAIGDGNVECSGGPLPGAPVTINFVGTLTHAIQPLLVVQSSLTGGTVPVADIEGTSDNIPPGAKVTLTSDETQTITVTGAPTSGTIKLTFGGDSVGIDLTATALAVQNALESIGSIGTGNVKVMGGQPKWTVTFIGDLGGQQQALIQADGSGLKGGTNPAVDVAETFQGGQTIGPKGIPAGTGVLILTGVPCGTTWEVEITAPDYDTFDGSVDVITGVTTSVGAALVPTMGLIVMPGTPAPFAAPGSVTVADPLGNSSLNLVGFGDGSPNSQNAGFPIPRGTALYCGQATFGTVNITWQTPGPPACPSMQSCTYTGPQVAATYFATIGCLNTLYAMFVHDLPSGTYDAGICDLTNLCTPITYPVACGDPLPARTCGGVGPNGPVCPCQGSEAHCIPVPARLPFTFCYGADLSLASGNPVDLTFTTEWSPNGSCDELWNQLCALYGVNYPPLSTDASCLVVQLSG